MRWFTSRSVFCLLLTLLAWLAATTAATAAVRHVPGDFTTIQAAVAASGAGDTVLVAAGVYGDCTHETEGPGSTPACVIMKSGVTVRGAGPEATIIDAGGLGRVVFIELVSDCRLENLRITGANAPIYGAGLLIRQVGASVRVTDVDVAGNLDGGVICINEAHPVLTRVNCLGNVAKQGGGLAIEEGSSPVVSGCLISGNQAPSGGGIFIRNQCAPQISDCVIEQNVINAAYGAGGGIAVVAAAPIITGCRIQGNTSLGYGGGVAYLDDAGGELSDCLIAGNDVTAAYNYGGGVYISFSGPLLRRCVIVDNRASGPFAAGGGVVVDFTTASRLENCTLAGNRKAGLLCQFGAAPEVDKSIIAFTDGGPGLLCDGGAPVVSCSDVYGNSGGDALCGTDAGGNFSADPQFCGTVDRPYNPAAGSPCAPGNHPGGPQACGGELIGALPAGCGGTGVAAGAAPRLRLLGNQPNPFNPQTVIFFVLEQPAPVTLRILDPAGRLVLHRALGQLSAGTHQAAWDGRARDGRAAASGVYLYELEAGGMRQTQRMLLVR